MLKMLEKIAFLSVKLVFWLIPVETLQFLKFNMNQKKVFFKSIFDMVHSKVIQNLVHFQ